MVILPSIMLHTESSCVITIAIVSQIGRVYSVLPGHHSSFLLAAFARLIYLHNNSPDVFQGEDFECGGRGEYGYRISTD